MFGLQLCVWMEIKLFVFCVEYICFKSDHSTAFSSSPSPSSSWIWRFSSSFLLLLFWQMNLCLAANCEPAAFAAFFLLLLLGIATFLKGNHNEVLSSTFMMEAEVCGAAEWSFRGWQQNSLGSAPPPFTCQTDALEMEECSQMGLRLSFWLLWYLFNKYCQK